MQDLYVGGGIDDTGTRRHSSIPDSVVFGMGRRSLMVLGTVIVMGRRARRAPRFACERAQLGPRARSRCRREATRMWRDFAIMFYSLLRSLDFRFSSPELKNFLRETFAAETTKT